MAELVSGLQDVLEAVRHAGTGKSAEKVYPTPATWQETYPELYAAPTPPEGPPEAAEAPASHAAQVRKWPWQR
jgi:hypothetical protein